MEQLDKVIRDIYKQYEYPVKRIRSISRRPQVERTALLNFNSSAVLRSSKPMCPENMKKLEAYLKAHPTELEADNYPGNIIGWIRNHLMEWETGDLLGCYLPEHQAIELYWLSIALCAESNRFKYRDLAVCVDAHEWCHALIHLWEDADGEPIGHCEQHTFEVSEGLAQYFTHHHLKSTPSSSCYKTFVKLMANQPPAYHAHLRWLSGDDLNEYLEIDPFFTKPIERMISKGAGEIFESTPLDLVAFSNWMQISREEVRQAILAGLRRSPALTLDEFNASFIHENRTLDNLLGEF